MADSSFKTVKVSDSTIGDITPELVFAVSSGASSTTYQSFPCNSPSNSSVSFAVTIPSEAIVLGRDVLMRAGLNFTVSCGGVPAGQPAFKYGVDSALAPFPLASIMNTVNCQVNNTSVSINLGDVLPQLLQMNDREHLAYYNGMTPSLPDGDYGQFADALGAGNNPLATYVNDSYSNKLQARGAHPVTITVLHYTVANGALPLDASLISTLNTDTWKIVIKALVTEPLFLSPFTWGNPERNAQGLCGINNLAFTFNLNSLNRLMSTASAYVTGVTAGSAAEPSLFALENPTLLFKFLSTQPSDLIASKNVVPFTEYPRYLTTAQAPILAGATSPSISTQSLQLNQMPSKIILCARKPMGTQTFADASTFLTIKSISVNLNNASGLLSSASAQDLWRISARNGSNQTWAQFNGFATAPAATYAGTNGIVQLATGGSLLVLDPAMDLSLPDYITNGSLGNYNLQIQVVLQNQYGDAITPDIVIVCVNDGILSTTQGVSQTFTGIITKQMTLDAKAMKGVSSVEEARMIGGKMHNMSKLRRPMSAGVMSAGVSSGGRSKLSGLY